MTETEITTADVIVVGGGIMGASAAVHLLEAGAGHVVLVERDDVAQGTSAYGAGFIGEWAAGYVTTWGPAELAIEQYGLEFYRKLNDEVGDIGYRPNGNLWVATTPEAWDTYLSAIASSPDVSKSETVGPDRIEQLTGILAADSVFRGVFHPNGAQVEADKATRGVVRKFVAAGGDLRTHHPVDRILVDDGRVVGVQTQHGTIHAPTVVLAGGPWTNNLLTPLGQWLPMAPLVASRVVTEPIGVPDTMPTLMLQEFDFIWLREHHGGLLWGCSYEESPRYHFVDREVPLRLDQLPQDGLNRTLEVGRTAAGPLPQLAGSWSYTTGQGLPSYTADTHAMVGALPAVEGLYVSAGCNEAGVSHGPGYGRLIADLVVRGASDFIDASVLNPVRFADEFSSVSEVASAVASSGTIFDLSDSSKRSA